jgi:hypothetical protein
VVNAFERLEKFYTPNVNTTAENIIRNYGLLPHPEGGFYRETYRSPDEISIGGKIRNTATAIYYLLNDHDKSHFHRLSSDELWFFHQGEPLEILMIDEAGNFSFSILGVNDIPGSVPQLAIRAGIWFASRVKGGNGFSLVSCVVAPGFDFADFEMGNRAALIALYPRLRAEIEEMSL